MLRHYMSHPYTPSLVPDLVDALPHGFVEFTPDGQVRRTNRRLRNLLGLRAPADALWKRVASAEDAARLRRALAQAGTPAPVTVAVHGEDEALRWLRFDWFEASPAISGRAALVADVSEQRAQAERLQDELRFSKEHLDLFFNQALDGFFFMMLDEPVRWDDGIDKEAALDYIFAHQRVTRVNQSQVNQYRAEETQLLGLTPADWFKDDLAQGRAAFTRFLDQGYLNLESDERRADGQWIRIEGGYVCLYDNQGRVTGLFGVQRDITQQVEAKRQLQESEAKYRSLFEHSLDGLLFYRRDGDVHRILAANPAACAMLGHSEAALMQRGLPLYLDPDDPAVLASMAERTQTGAYRGELAARHADGRWLPFDVVAVEFPRQNGVTYGWTLFRDISERKQAEGALKQSRDDVRRLWALLQSVREEEQQRLALALQDELGQWLAVIKLDLGWLRRRLSAASPGLEQRVAETAATVDAAIEGIQRLSRHLRPRALDDIGLVGACEALLSDFQRQSGLRATLCLSHAELTLESTLKTAVFRIVEEALENVRQHAQASQVRVELLQEEAVLTLRIADDGRSFLSKALEPPEALGLVQIRERVRLLSGQFSVRAQPGGGSELSITLPLAQGELPPLR
jgi:PAS domain S-box-containing protein